MKEGLRKKKQQKAEAKTMKNTLSFNLSSNLSFDTHMNQTKVSRKNYSVRFTLEAVKEENQVEIEKKDIGYDESIKIVQNISKLKQVPTLTVIEPTPKHKDDIDNLQRNYSEKVQVPKALM